MDRTKPIIVTLFGKEVELQPFRSRPENTITSWHYLDTRGCYSLDAHVQHFEDETDFTAIIDLQMSISTYTLANITSDETADTPENAMRLVEQSFNKMLTTIQDTVKELKEGK